MVTIGKHTNLNKGRNTANKGGLTVAKLRYLTTCDKHGVKDGPHLQYWDPEYYKHEDCYEGKWCDIPSANCHIREQYETEKNPDPYNF